jgi:hypothetical protein
LPILSLPVVHTSTSCCPHFHFLFSLSLLVHTFTSCCPYFHFLQSEYPTFST